MLARAGRRELWAGALKAGEACVAAVDPCGRAVVWLGRLADEDAPEPTVAEACVPGSGGLWRGRRGATGEKRDAWEAVRRAHALALLAAVAGLRPELLADVLATEPRFVEVAVDAWLEGNETAAVGAIQAPVIARAAAGAADSTAAAQRTDPDVTSTS